MDGNRRSAYDVEPLSEEEQPTAQRVSVEQLERLVRLLDTSDVSEVEIKHPIEGTKLVLRKAKIAENQEIQIRPEATNGHIPPEAPVETTQRVVASLVGVFHPWARPRGGTLVAVGDRVKAGQLVGTIQSLNVLNEVESPTNGRVVEILVQDGQPVEYGQHLMTIEIAQEA